MLQGESWDLTAIVWQGGRTCGSRVHMAHKPWPAWGLQGEGVDQGQGGFTWILSRGERLSAGKAGSSESSYPSPCEGTAPRPSVRGQAPRPSSRGTPYSALARIYARTYETKHRSDNEIQQQVHDDVQQRNDCGRRHAWTGKTPDLWTVRDCSLPMEKKGRLDADLWTGTFAHTGLKRNASNIHL